MLILASFKDRIDVGETEFQIEFVVRSGYIRGISRVITSNFVIQYLGKLKRILKQTLPRLKLD